MYTLPYIFIYSCMNLYFHCRFNAKNISRMLAVIIPDYSLKNVKNEEKKRKIEYFFIYIYP